MCIALFHWVCYVPTASCRMVLTRTRSPGLAAAVLQVHVLRPPGHDLQGGRQGRHLPRVTALRHPRPGLRPVTVRDVAGVCHQQVRVTLGHSVLAVVTGPQKGFELVVHRVGL